MASPEDGYVCVRLRLRSMKLVLTRGRKARAFLHAEID